VQRQWKASERRVPPRRPVPPLGSSVRSVPLAVPKPRLAAGFGRRRRPCAAWPDIDSGRTLQDLARERRRRSRACRVCCRPIRQASEGRDCGDAAREHRSGVFLIGFNAYSGRALGRTSARYRAGSGVRPARPTKPARRVPAAFRRRETAARRRSRQPAGGCSSVSS
jgi:hypothetical protein